MGGPASTHVLPGLDWMVKLGLGLILAAAGLLLIQPPRRRALRFALGIFIIETGTLVAIRGIVAAGGSTGWQYLMPLAPVLVPGLFIAVVLTRLHWWRRVGFTPVHEWRALHLLISLALVLALPLAGLWARGVMATTALVLALQVGFLLIDIFMEEVTYRGVVLQALSGFSPFLRGQPRGARHPRKGDTESARRRLAGIQMLTGSARHSASIADHRERDKD